MCRVGGIQFGNFLAALGWNALGFPSKLNATCMASQTSAKTTRDGRHSLGIMCGCLLRLRAKKKNPPCQVLTGGNANPALFPTHNAKFHTQHEFPGQIHAFCNTFRMARPKGATGTKHLIEAERARVPTLYFDAQFKLASIKEKTSFTTHQIRDAIQAPSFTVSKYTGRPCSMTKEQEDKLLEFVTALQKNRKMCFLTLS